MRLTSVSSRHQLLVCSGGNWSDSCVGLLLEVRKRGLIDSSFVLSVELPVDHNFTPAPLFELTVESLKTQSIFHEDPLRPKTQSGLPFLVVPIRRVCHVVSDVICICHIITV